MDLQGIKVLVVDDDEDLVSLIGDLLASRSAHVMTATKGSDAVSLLSMFRPDVIVSDINMPECDGYQLLRMIRIRGQQYGGHAPAIALTARREVIDHTRCKLAGYSLHIPKPFDPEVLCAAIKRLARA